MSDGWVVTDPNTGGRKGQKVARFDLIPPKALRQLAEHYGRGARKYEDRNWEKGYQYSLSYAAMMRHVTAWWGGEDYDEEGNHHLDAVMFHCMALREFGNRGVGTDNRPDRLDAYGGKQEPMTGRDVWSDTLEMYEALGPKATGDGTTGSVTVGEQTEDEGWVGTIQARRWEIP